MSPSKAQTDLKARGRIFPIRQAGEPIASRNDRRKIFGVVSAVAGFGGVGLLTNQFLMVDEFSLGLYLVFVVASLWIGNLGRWLYRASD